MIIFFSSFFFSLGKQTKNMLIARCFQVIFPLRKLQGISSRVAALHVVQVDHLVHVLKASTGVWKPRFWRRDIRCFFQIEGGSLPKINSKFAPENYFWLQDVLHCWTKVNTLILSRTVLVSEAMQGHEKRVPIKITGKLLALASKVVHVFLGCFWLP